MTGYQWDRRLLSDLRKRARNYELNVDEMLLLVDYSQEAEMDRRGEPCDTTCGMNVSALRDVITDGDRLSEDERKVYADWLNRRAVAIIDEEVTGESDVNVKTAVIVTLVFAILFIIVFLFFNIGGALLFCGPLVLVSGIIAICMSVYAKAPSACVPGNVNNTAHFAEQVADEALARTRGAVTRNSFKPLVPYVTTPEGYVPYIPASLDLSDEDVDESHEENSSISDKEADAQDFARLSLKLKHGGLTDDEQERYFDYIRRNKKVESSTTRR